MIDDDDLDEWPDTGQFCSHYSDPCDCEEICLNCGHLCRQHYGDDYCHRCECAGFKDVPESIIQNAYELTDQFERDHGKV